MAVNGSAGNDLIHVSGDGVLTPPGFTDIPQATDFEDALYGLGGNDLIYGGGGRDDIDGGDGNDVLYGGDGDEVIQGGNGNDLLIGGAGQDTLLGGAGIDIIRYDGPAGVLVNLHTCRGHGGDAEGDVFFGVESVEGTNFVDNLFGSSASETLRGRDGDDSIAGFGGNDLLFGDAGKDRVLGGDGNDGLSGGDGDDDLDGGAGADRLDGGLGADMIDYARRTVGVTVDLSTGRCAGGEAEGDTLSSIENIYGSDAGDTLTGSSVANLLIGSSGNDVLTGLAGDDQLYGSEGDDVLRGGAGADELGGHTGNDLVTYFGTAIAVTVDLLHGVGSGGEAEGDTYSEIDNVNGSTAGDYIFGNAGANVFNGYEGDDRLFGYDGDDTLIAGPGDDLMQGGAGADRLEGGAGIDTVEYYGAVGVRVELSTGLGVGGEAQGDRLSGLENIHGTGFGDVLTGSAVANHLEGRGGDDVLDGLGGADVLFGDIGDDTLRGGDGDDVLYLDNGNDLLDGGAGRDTLVFLSAMTADWQAGVFDPSIAGDNWQGWEVIQGSSGDDRIVTGSFGFAVELRGGAGNDVLAAGIDGAVGDTLLGEDGNDNLNGGVGDDVLRGGAGADVLEGSAGTDTASYFTGSIGVSVNLATGLGNGGEAQGDTLSGIENLSGSQGNDSLIGNTYANILQGSGGNDVLTGAGGPDTLTGGTGADRFVYGSAAQSPVGAGADRITDFSHGQGDRIDLAAIDASTAVAGDQAFSFIGGGLYTGVAGQLRYAVFDGVTIIGGDLNGDKVTDFHITLTGTIALVAADFVL
ncbi:MAG: calcium-binding protein [Inquilinus limosus]|uniref:Calcium-binding protein n=1 Tax=Inquilinus limosus TaxID=171674 RepID=A0A952FHX5_9PROT|nr:calcium-binding protein [Inquilinus limosus]